MKKILRRLLLIVVCLSFLTADAFAVGTVSPRSSEYIKGTSAEIAYRGNGKIEIGFWVSGTSVMTDIGATLIELYEWNEAGDSIKRVATYRYTDPGYSHMMGYNTGIHSSSVTYNGTAGRQYYARVHLKAGNSSGSDTYIHIAQ